MRRLTRGRAATDDEATPTATGTSEAAGAATDPREAGAEPVPANGTGEPATAVVAPGTTASEPATAAEPGAATDVPGRDLPAGVDLDELRAAPASSASRGKLRRRVSYLRRVRELLLRDLGGFYAEAHRSEQGADAHRRLLDAKAHRLTTLDAEIRELEDRLSEPHAETILREPGIGGTCPECGELFGSGARYCWRCGTPLTGRAARERAAAKAAHATPATGATGATGTTGGPAATGVTGSRTIPPATGAAAEEERMTTASLWGRRRSPAPAEPAAETRAADLTQAAPPEEEPGTRAAPAAAADDEPETRVESRQPSPEERP